MNKIDATSVIAVCSLIAVLYGVIELSNYPLKRDIGKIESNQANLEKRMDRIESKLDRLIADLIQKKSPQKKAVLTVPKAQ